MGAPKPISLGPILDYRATQSYGAGQIESYGIDPLQYYWGAHSYGIGAIQPCRDSKSCMIGANLIQ